MTTIRVRTAVERASEWRIQHDPGANAQATATRAAAGRGKCNVLTGLTVMLCAGATAPTAVVVQVAVIDGASGGTSYLWGPHRISVPAVAGVPAGIARQPLWITGTPDTAMTIEFLGAGGANTFETVSAEGTIIG